jgi:hypothetical protein
LQAHEFGHIFGLDHNWPKDNIMGGGPPEGGFNAEQVKIMLDLGISYFKRIEAQTVPNRLLNGTFDTELTGATMSVQAMTAGVRKVLVMLDELYPKP